MAGRQAGRQAGMQAGGRQAGSRWAGRQAGKQDNNTRADNTAGHNMNAAALTVKQAVVFLHLGADNTAGQNMNAAAFTQSSRQLCFCICRAQHALV